ncbi:Beta-lactamase superfamily domain [Geoglobus ahangari]|uniref:Beta-lactamase superfamily domain n=1 Tax=Geoglobus ahangari TaxID=113653 RepID=A0A0F7IC39_9EURY|nr:mRNA 3'-end processing factor [Geoglobus ahangari]AKG90783.1 Beta-lactamase superfamily domain [Geoglobus ahangari]
MSILDIAESFGTLIFRRKYGRGFRPHFSIRVNGVDFHIDSSPGKGYNIITHAHSDHFGQRNMKNHKAIASTETAKILEAVSGERFRGSVHEVGERLKLGGVSVATYPTHHMHGSTAYHFRDSGILITGDVKDFSDLPECEFLIAEATYGHPNYVFDDEIDRVIEVAENGYELGVYPIGKAQRIATLLSQHEIGFRTVDKIERICRALGIDYQDGDAMLLPPKSVTNGYVLSAQNFYRNRITVSDHVDYRGIIGLVEHCNPDYVLFYHGNPTKRLVSEIERSGRKVLTLSDIDVWL